MYPHPVAQLVRAHLGRSSRFHVVPGVSDALLHEAVARFGSGINHTAGETPIAMLTSPMDSQSTARGNSLTYVITDRRLFGRIKASNTPLLFTDVPYAEVAAMPAKPGAMAQSVVVQTGYRPNPLYLAPKELHAFFSALVTTIPPAGRTFGPLILPPRSEQDPVGAWGAAQAVGGYDARTSVPLRIMFETHRRGTIDGEFAASLVPPMIVQARTVSFGRGSGPAGWFSVLPRPVLAHAIRAVLGEPAAVYPAPATDVMDFFIGAGSGAGSAVASSVVGLAMLATLGVGWVSTSSGHKLTAIRVQVTDAPEGSAFALLGTTATHFESLSAHWWRAVDTIHQALARLEARYLLGRALFGPQAPATDLLSLPRDVLEAHVAGLIGPTNLATFYPS